MPTLVSAASRLHPLLAEINAVENSQPLRASWSRILGVPEDDVEYGEFGLPLVARLVGDAAGEATRAESRMGLPLRQDLIAEWAKPVYAPGGNLDGPVTSSEWRQRLSPI